jgi:peptide/nickel transport system substrate-binding protein
MKRTRARRRTGERGMQERMRWLVLALAAVLVGVVVGTAPAARDTLVVGMPTDAAHLDDHEAAGPEHSGILSQVAEPLVRLTRDGQIVPWLVESWQQSRDGRTWTLHLRRGVRFSDGTPFDAEALRVNLERLRRHSTSQAAPALVTSMAVAGEHVLEVTTEAPFAPFMSSLGAPGIVIYSPTQILDAGDDHLPAAPVGTGPFKVAHPRRGQDLRLEANDQYWGGKPRLRAIVGRPYPDQGARTQALESGDVDLVGHVTPQAAARLARNPSLAIATPPSARSIWIWLDTQGTVFRDTRVRQALSHAIDREAIVKSIFLGYAETSDRYRYDPDLARRLLAEAGAADLSFTLRHVPGRYLHGDQVVEAIQGSLARVGVTMRVADLEREPPAPLISRPVEGNREQAVLLDELDGAPASEALWLYGEPQIWAARRSLKGVEWSIRGTIQSLHAAYFED